MKTLTKNLAKRSLSVLLVLMMVFSLLTVGLTTASAAEVELEETGKKQATIEIDTTKSSDLRTNPHIYVYENDTAIGKAWPGTQLTKTNNRGNYEFTVTFNDHYYFIVNNDNNVQTDNNLSSFNSSILVTFTGNKSYTTEVIGDAVEAAPDVFWADLDGDKNTTIDRIYADNTFYETTVKNNYPNSYFICLPSSAKNNFDKGNKTVKLFAPEGKTLTVAGTNISSTGTDFDITNYQTAYFQLGGDFTGTVYFRFSEGITSIHTITETDIPQHKGVGDSKDSYNSVNDSKGTGSDTQFIKVIGPTGEIKNPDDDVLDKVKGRGNSSWKASSQLIGKYAFNITLDKKANLLNSGTTKKYCLVSYNADQARMRNMIAYQLADEIGLEFSPKFEPVDFYNNGNYIGSYLLTDKVEIGSSKSPLVKLDVNLDDENEELVVDGVEVNKAICKDPTGHRKTGVIKNGTYNTESNTVINSLTEDTKPGYFKYVEMTEPDESIYQDSGFLLEFELKDRFKNEISGFISNKGQQIVCKYPENATKKQMLFIIGKWNKAEDIIYNGVDGKPATYEQLDRVIDVESFAKMYLLQELSKNVDAGSTSYYVYYHDGKLHAGVAWDFDWAFGQYKESGDPNEKVLKQISGDFLVDSPTNNADNVHNNPKGWWANSREIYPNQGTLNVQAQLCQNPNFWSVVEAEWNEVFYDAAMDYVTESAISNGDISNMQNDTIADDIYPLLDGKIKDFYQMVRPSTWLDEYKWGIIYRNPLENWMSADTGENHNQAVANLNNFILNRLNWMNTGATKYHLDCDDYKLAIPTLTTDKASYEANETITLTAKTNSSGNLTYTLYDAAENELESITTNLGYAEFTQTADKNNTTYSVKVSSANTTSVTDAAEATIEVTGVSFTPTISASANSVLAGKDVTLTVGNEQNYENVEYSIYYKVNGGEAQRLNGNTYTQNTAGTVTFYVTASTTVDGETVTADSDTIDVVFTSYSITVNTSTKAPAIDQEITITATPNVDNIDATYELFVNDVLKEFNSTGVFKVTVDSYGTITYKVVATPTDEAIAPTTAQASVTVTEDTGEYTVKLLFKAPVAWAYQPQTTITVTGTDGIVKDVTVTKDPYAAISVEDSSQYKDFYMWYSYDLTVVGSDTISFEAKANRSYFYNGYYEFSVASEGSNYETTPTTGDTRLYFFALDNLNNDTRIPFTNVSNEALRDVSVSATNMITLTDAELNKLVATGYNFRSAVFGDANCDGKINVKDATYVQKSLANIITLDDLATISSDFNKDGKTTIKDATAIQKRIAGL